MKLKRFWLKVALADSDTEQVNERVDNSHIFKLLSSWSADYSTFIDSIKSLTPRSAEEMFASLQVIKKDMRAAVDHVEAMKRLLDWSNKAQSSENLKDQLDVLNEIIAETIKVDIVKVFFYNPENKLYSSVAFFHKVELDRASIHFTASEKMLSDLKSMQTMITPFNNTDTHFDHHIEGCFEEPITSYSMIPMINTLNQQYQGISVLIQVPSSWRIGSRAWPSCAKRTNSCSCSWAAFSSSHWPMLKLCKTPTREKNN